MNAIEILGGLLGKKSGSSSAGADILKDLIGGALRRPQQSETAGRPQQTGGSSHADGPDLGDFVREALSKFQARRGQPSPQQHGPQSSECNDPSHKNFGQASELDDAKAVVLIRAMINAAKADGQLDQREQDAIVKQLGEVTREEAQFLREEFAKPVEVRDFAWSVPLGLEQQVYSLSLMAIDLDQNKEAGYLRELAHGLRLKPDICNRIHQHYRAPLLYK